MSFHLGKPILVMLLITIISSGFIITQRPSRPADLVMWVFADAHLTTYRSIIDQFEKQTGKKVDIQHLTVKAEVMRLESMFLSDQDDPKVLPDVIEMEISYVGRFFLPPADQIGFEPLNEYLKRDNWDKRIVSSRFAPWSKGDTIFGVPHDVHPVTITYRHDLFEEAGVRLDEAKTWPEFQEMCLKFQDYWKARGYPTRHAMDLKEASSDYIIIMLLQRGLNLIDKDEKIRINDPIVAKTVAFYAQLVSGSRRIGWEGAPSSNNGLWITDVTEGNLCAFFTPDWRIYDVHSYGPQLQGKMRMMALPRFDPTDTPTSTWGGTMIGITRGSRHKEDAWKLIEFLYLSKAGLEARLKVTNILPPVIEMWDHPDYHAPDPFFGGQKINELYTELARQIPPRYVSAATLVAQIQLSLVVDRAVKYYQAHGTDGLEAECQKWLDLAASDLKRRIENGRFAD